MSREIDPRIPVISSDWQLWHTDMFDPDALPSLQASGTNIVRGLYELWLYTLKEAILDNGSASFSRFQLTWGKAAAARVDIFVEPFHNLPLMKLRQWADLISQNENRDKEQRITVVWRLAELHYELLQKSSRWNASAIDWSAESRELLARVKAMEDATKL